MNFTSISAGSSLFIDANVFVYSWTQDPSFGVACTDLLERIKCKELQGFSSSSDFSDTAHRMMTLEACQSLGWAYTGIAR